MEDIKSKEEARKILEKFQNDMDLANAENIIVDNTIVFEYKEVKYRVRLMTLKEKEELHMLRLKKFGQLMQDKDIMIEKRLIEVWKEKGIDIDKMNDDMTKLDAEILVIKKDLGKSLEQKDSEVILKSHKEKIENLIYQKRVISIQKEDALRNSLENQLLNYVAEVITYLTLDISNGSEWVRLFKTYEDFINCEDNELINMAGTRSMILQYF